MISAKEAKELSNRSRLKVADKESPKRQKRTMTMYQVLLRDPIGNYFISLYLYSSESDARTCKDFVALLTDRPIEIEVED
jgi:hypothetical protein